LFERLSLRASVINWPSSASSRAAHLVSDRALREPIHAGDAGLANLAQRFNATGSAKKHILEALGDDFAAVDASRGAAHYDLQVIALEGLSEAQRALRLYENELPPRTTMRGDALRAYAQLLDRILGEIAGSDPEQIVIVCSPSGVMPPALPGDAYSFAVRRLRDAGAGADDGFLLVSGPGAIHRPRPEPARVPDVVPTVLFAAGLPIGRDMDGHIVTDAFSDEFLRQSTLSAIQTYEAEQLLVRRSGA
jgi:hypothetical protein